MSKNDPAKLTSAERAKNVERTKVPFCDILPQPILVLSIDPWPVCLRDRSNIATRTAGAFSPLVFQFFLSELLSSRFRRSPPLFSRKWSPILSRETAIIISCLRGK